MVTLRPVALYALSSAVDQEEAFISGEAQLGRMREYAGQNGMHPVSHFVDKHGSREEFDWMMAQATGDNPPFRTVLVYSFSRLTRSASELKALLGELEVNGLELISVTRGRVK